MTEYNEGDLVEAVKGERRVVDRIRKDEEGDLYIHGVGHLSNCFLGAGMNPAVNAGYTLTVIERATPPLPTASGLYLHRNGIDVLYLGLDGSWTSGTEYGVDPARVAREAAPLVLLEPVPVTAKRVLGRVQEEFDGSDRRTLDDDLAAVATEFGVEP